MRTPTRTAAKPEFGPCTLDTLDHCSVCGEAMHRRDGRQCRNRHRQHEGRGLCTNCYAVLRNRGLLDEHPCTVFGRDDLLAEWRTLAIRGEVTFWNFGPAIGMTQAAWQRAYERARAAGHPLARRIDKET